MKIIEKQVNKYPIQVLSRTLGIARSRIYRHLEGKVSSRRKASEGLEQAIRQVYLESNKIYGAPKVYAALIRQGIKTSLKRVQRHMKAMGIHSIIRKRYRPCCSKQTKPVCHHPNIVKQDFNTPTVNQVWCVDITYIYTLQEGCPYDNACMESFHASLKKEEVYMKQYRNYEGAQVHLFKYIEGWYNTRRLHSSLDYQPPDYVYQNG